MYTYLFIGDYEIVTADGEFGENGMIIDAATLKRAVKVCNIKYFVSVIQMCNISKPLIHLVLLLF